MNVRRYFASHTTSFKCEHHVHTGKELSYDYQKVSQKSIEKQASRVNDLVVQG